MSVPGLVSEVTDVHNKLEWVLKTSERGIVDELSLSGGRTAGVQRLLAKTRRNLLLLLMQERQALKDFAVASGLSEDGLPAMLQHATARPSSAVKVAQTRRRSASVPRTPTHTPRRSMEFASPAVPHTDRSTLPDTTPQSSRTRRRRPAATPAPPPAAPSPEFQRMVLHQLHATLESKLRRLMPPGHRIPAATITTNDLLPGSDLQAAVGLQADLRKLANQLSPHPTPPNTTPHSDAAAQTDAAATVEMQTKAPPPSPTPPPPKPPAPTNPSPVSSALADIKALMSLVTTPSPVTVPDVSMATTTPATKPSPAFSAATLTGNSTTASATPDSANHLSPSPTFQGGAQPQAVTKSLRALAGLPPRSPSRSALPAASGAVPVAMRRARRRLSPHLANKPTPKPDVEVAPSSPVVTVRRPSTLGGGVRQPSKLRSPTGWMETHATVSPPKAAASPPLTPVDVNASLSSAHAAVLATRADAEQLTRQVVRTPPRHSRTSGVFSEPVSPIGPTPSPEDGPDAGGGADPDASLVFLDSFPSFVFSPSRNPVEV